MPARGSSCSSPRVRPSFCAGRHRTALAHVLARRPTWPAPRAGLDRLSPARCGRLRGGELASGPASVTSRWRCCARRLEHEHAPEPRRLAAGGARPGAPLHAATPTRIQVAEEALPRRGGARRPRGPRACPRRVRSRPSPDTAKASRRSCSSTRTRSWRLVIARAPTRCSVTRSSSSPRSPRAVDRRPATSSTAGSTLRRSSSWPDPLHRYVGAAATGR